MQIFSPISQVAFYRETSYVHDLEDLVLLKCPSYPKQSKVSMQSQSKFVIFFKNRKKHPKIQMKAQETLNYRNNLRKEVESLYF